MRHEAGGRWTMARVALAALAVSACASGTPGAADPKPAQGVRVKPLVDGLHDPVYVTAPPGDSRLFIVEQEGRIRVFENGRLLRRPFLDLTDRVLAGGERGLLSMAFHPQYAANRFFFVNYTDRNGHTRVVRYTATADRNMADPESGRLILLIPQPYANHNGGLVLFGPDGMLYIGMGDGGSAGDPHGNGQNLQSLLGKMLRIDVDRGNPYAIPPDNPFARGKGGRPEIWAWGLRNPWRFAFDPVDRLLYIADVGQNRWEEVDVVPAGRAGINYGWNLMEGDHCFKNPGCTRAGLAPPAFEYDHRQGCSITGGSVYRGRRVPALVGHYVFADFCSGWIRSFRYSGGQTSELREWRLPESIPVSSFGTDAEGELYVVSHAGRVFKVVADR
jgi:glucose/arabinose dehydrogenase